MHAQDLDSAGFAVQLAYHIWSHAPTAGEAQSFYLRWAGPLERSLNATLVDPAGSGLMWSNTSAPNVGYGFQVRMRRQASNRKERGRESGGEKS